MCEDFVNIISGYSELVRMVKAIVVVYLMLY